MLIIRNFEPPDAAQVSELVRRTMRVSNGADYPPETLQPLIDYYSPQKILQLGAERSCLIAEINAEIVGTVALEENQLVTFFVAPEFQGAGIGKKLLAAIERVAAEKKIRRLTLDSSITALPFYEKMNYRKMRIVVKNGAGEIAEMEKTLKNL